jgi:hypothetical protein
VLALPVLPARSARREGRELTTEGTEDTEY